MPSGTNVLINKNLCRYYKLFWSKCKKLFLEKKIPLFVLGFKWNSKNKFIKWSSLLKYSWSWSVCIIPWNPVRCCWQKLINYWILLSYLCQSVPMGFIQYGLISNVNSQLVCDVDLLTGLGKALVFSATMFWTNTGSLLFSFALLHLMTVLSIAKSHF